MEIEFKLMDILREYSRVKTDQVITRMHYKDMSVAEHSYFVAIITMMLYIKLMAYPSFKKDMKKKFGDQGLAPLAYLLVKSLLKGLPESVFSDIGHDTRLLLKAIAPGTFENIEKSFFQSTLIRDMLSSMDAGLSKIVELADMLSIYLYTKDEDKRGNVTLNDITEDTIMKIKTMGQYFPDGFIGDLFTSKGWEL
jgi:hypothetical protein